MLETIGDAAMLRAPTERARVLGHAPVGHRKPHTRIFGTVGDFATRNVVIHAHADWRVAESGGGEKWKGRG